MSIYLKEMREDLKRANQVIENQELTNDDLQAIRKALRDYTNLLGKGSVGQFVGIQVENMVNNMSEVEPQNCVEYLGTIHRTLQSNVFRFVLKIVKMFAEKDENFADARNISAIRNARKLQSFIEENNIDKLPYI